MADTNMDRGRPVHSSTPLHSPGGSTPIMSPTMDIPTQGPSYYNTHKGELASPGVTPTVATGGSTVVAISDQRHEYGTGSGPSTPDVGQGQGVDVLQVLSPTTSGDALDTLVPCTLSFHVDHFSDEGELTHGISSTNLLEEQYEEPEVIVHHMGGAAAPEVCTICLGWEEVSRRPCCAVHACTSCTRYHVTTQISMGVLAIECPSCDVILPEVEVLGCLDVTMTKKYKLLKRLRAQALRKGVASRGEAGSSASGSVRVRVGDCVTSDDDDDDDDDDDEETGSDAESDNMAAWAGEEDHVTGLANARRCPECQIYIQKRAGCYNIKCPLCGVKFCYKCGERLPHDMSLHRNRNLTVHRPWVRCHGLGLCCSKFCSGLRDCCCSRRWLQVVRLGLCFLLLALLALLVLHVSGIVL